MAVTPADNASDTAREEKTKNADVPPTLVANRKRIVKPTENMNMTRRTVPITTSVVIVPTGFLVSMPNTLFTDRVRGHEKTIGANYDAAQCNESEGERPGKQANDGILKEFTGRREEVDQRVSELLLHHHRVCKD